MHARPRHSPVEGGSRHQRIVRSLLEQNTPVSFIAEGPSMNPSIRDGDLVFVQPADPASLRRGQVVLFSGSDRLILHRHVGRGPETASIRVTGDAALRGSEIMAIHRVCGIAVGLERNGKRCSLDRVSIRVLGLCRYYARPIRRMLHTVRVTGIGRRCHGWIRPRTETSGTPLFTAASDPAEPRRPREND